MHLGRDDGSTVVLVGSWTVGQGRDLWSIVHRQRIVVSYDLTHALQRVMAQSGFWANSASYS